MNGQLMITRNVAFWRGTAVALALSFFGSAVFSVSTPLVGTGSGARLVLTVLSLLYLLFVLKTTGYPSALLTGRSSRRTRGVMVSLSLWSILVVALCLVNPSIWFWLVALVGMVWLVRCLRCYHSLIAAAGDAVLNGLALTLALATALHTQSVFLSLWCFFLTQAAVVFVPGFERNSLASAREDSEQSFDAAYHTAEAAIRRLSVRQ
jgi:hypothetical protein